MLRDEAELGLHQVVLVAIGDEGKARAELRAVSAGNGEAIRTNPQW
jgi:hypothetical protein